MIFTIIAYNFLFGIEPNYRLREDCSWKEISDFEQVNTTDMKFISHSDAVTWLKLHKNLIIGNISVNTSPYKSVQLGDTEDMDFEILVHRTSKPHLFTLEELKIVLANGNDNLNNSLIIDFDGHIKLIPLNRNHDLIGYSQYAVRNESYNAGNSYVGEIFDNEYLYPLYLNLLNEWVAHLQTGRSMYIDFEETDLNEADLLIEINKIYSSLV